MATKCFPVLRGRRIRLTRLDGCGRPVYGPDSVVVTKGFVSVALTANIDEGEAITVTNASGENCINEPAVPTLNGFGVAITFCGVEPDAMSIAAGQEPYLDYAGDSAGFTIDTAVSLNDTAFALEMWMGSPSGDACAGEVGEGSYGYVLLPFVQGGILGDFTVENAAINLAISNAATKTGGNWGVGPYDVLYDDVDPAPLPRALTSTEPFLLVQTTLAPPEDYCGARPLLDPTDTALTSITATPSAGMNLSVTAAPAGSDPFWVDFGDGSWDYSDDGSALAHTYTTTGSKTVVAYRGSSTASATPTIIA